MQTYAYYFTHLNRNVMRGEVAPHKIILLLALIDLVSQSYIKSQRVVLDDTVKECFGTLWNRYVGASSVYRPIAKTPFIHMDYEPFWKLQSTMPRQPLCAMMAVEMFELLQVKNNRAYFRRLLIGQL